MTRFEITYIKTGSGEKKSTDYVVIYSTDARHDFYADNWADDLTLVIDPSAGSDHVNVIGSLEDVRAYLESMIGECEV